MKEVPKKRTLVYFNTTVIGIEYKRKFVLTHGGKTGRGDSDTAFQGGPDIHVHKMPCRITVCVQSSKFGNTNNGGNTYAGKESVRFIVRQIGEARDLQYPQQKYPRQADFLSIGGIQSPDHRDGKAENQDVGREIQHTSDNAETS